MSILQKGDLVIFLGNWSKPQSIFTKNNYGQIGIVFDVPDANIQVNYSIIGVCIGGDGKKKFDVQEYYRGDLSLLIL